MKFVDRFGRFFRVANPAWGDPLDPSYAKRFGGRWTPQGEFGALYLNATIEVAAANARAQHRDRAIKLFDLRPESRPQLITVEVPQHDVVDIVRAEGIAAVDLPDSYPFGVPHTRCHPIARAAYANRTAGIACRSNAEATETTWLGEELALLDRALPVPEVGSRKAFSSWYLDADPDAGGLAVGAKRNLSRDQ